MHGAPMVYWDWTIRLGTLCLINISGNLYLLIFILNGTFTSLFAASDASLTAEAKNKENILAKKNPTTTEEIAGSLSPSLLCSNSKTTVGFEQSGKDCLIKPGCSQVYSAV